MSFTNQTPNYGLPQYIESDKPSVLVDMNKAYEKIDSVMYSNAKDLDSINASINAVNGRMDGVEQEFAQTQQVANTALANSTNAVSTANNALQQSTLAEHHAELAATSAEASKNAAQQAAHQISGLANQVQTNTNNISSLTTTVNNLNTKTENLTQQVTNVNQFIETVSDYKKKYYDRGTITFWPGYENLLLPTSTAGWPIEISYNPDLKIMILNTGGNRVIRVEWDEQFNITNFLPTGANNTLIPTNLLVNKNSSVYVPLFKLPFQVPTGDTAITVNLGTFSQVMGSTATGTWETDTIYYIKSPFVTYTNLLVVLPLDNAPTEGWMNLWLAIQWNLNYGPPLMTRTPAVGDGRTCNLSSFSQIMADF